MRAVVLLASVFLAGIAGAAEPTDFVLPSGQVVPGAYLDDIPSLTVQTNRLRAAMQSVLHTDMGRVPVHVVPIDVIRLLHEEVGGRMRSGWQLHGFELDGHVFVRRGIGGISDEVLTHECLHAMSEKFSREAHARGIVALVEGTTQYFTLQVLAARPSDRRLRVQRNRTYVAYTELADALATLVGEDFLREAYLGGGFVKLCQRVDTLRKQRHVLERAASALDHQDERAAVRILTGAK